MVKTIIRRGAVTGATIFGLEAAYALLKPSPELESFDPSGTFGDPALPPLSVAVLGDSSVTAPGVAGPEEIWVSLICERLAKTHHVTLASYAVGGSRARDIVADQLDEATAAIPDLAFVSVGANDAIKGVSLKNFATNLDTIVRRLADTGATVVQSGVGVLGSIPRLYPPLSTFMSRRAAKFDRVHWRIAGRYGTTVVNQRSDSPQVWNRDRSLWAADDFHVSAAGHARWADTTWRTVEPLMNGTGGPG